MPLAALEIGGQGQTSLGALQTGHGTAVAARAREMVMVSHLPKNAHNDCTDAPTHALVARWSRATELEGLTNLGTTMADGATGETSAVRELHTALREVRDGLTKAKKLWKAAEEAADKCQVCGNV